MANVALAVGAPGFILGLHQAGEEHGGEDGDDGDNDEEFDKGEGALTDYLTHPIVFVQQLEHRDKLFYWPIVCMNG
ncbi:hypothetical protein SDC9_171832 [bioreactor metagenome]|uniref:Uncharacterized protein n=1 Tax=bioreactor metagenome TaxID=1076179 RepID=A0A645GL33_9ZZZZ